MKKIFFLIAMYCAMSTQAQWEPLTVGTGNAPITSMYAYADTLFIAAYGEGIFKSTDNGTIWTDVSGDLANLNINDIRGGAAPTVTWVASDDGIFFTADQVSYANNTSTGLSNTDARYYWFGPEDDWAVATYGGGVYTSQELNGPWNPANNGISGDGLYVNDIGGYGDGTDEYACLVTEDGVYFTEDNFASWTQKNNGLSGDALHAKELAGVGFFVMIATHGGLFATFDMGDTWYPLVDIEKFNTIISGVYNDMVYCFAFGKKGYYANSLDLTDWIPIDIENIPGEVISVAFNSTHVFVGVEIPEKDGSRGGGIYRQPIDVITGLEEPHETAPNAKLLPCYPNPATDQTTLHYLLKKSGSVKIEVYDIHGKLVTQLKQGIIDQGMHENILNTRKMPSGIYCSVLLLNGKRVSSQKFIINK